MNNEKTTLPEPEADEPAALDQHLTELWIEYSKERFLAAEAQIREFRSWARQLGAAITVLIGLEMTIVAKVLFDLPHGLEGWRAAGVLLLLIAILLQLVMLSYNILTGYSGELVMGPESPTTLRFLLPDMPQPAAAEVFGRYYANGCDNSEKLQEKLGVRVHRQAIQLIVSFLLFLAGICALVIDVSPFRATQKGQPSRAVVGVVSSKTSPSQVLPRQ